MRAASAAHRRRRAHGSGPAAPRGRPRCAWYSTKLASDVDQRARAARRPQPRVDLVDDAVARARLTAARSSSASSASRGRARRRRSLRRAGFVDEDQVEVGTVATSRAAPSLPMREHGEIDAIPWRRDAAPTTMRRACSAARARADLGQACQRAMHRFAAASAPARSSRPMRSSLGDAEASQRRRTRPLRSRAPSQLLAQRGAKASSSLRALRLAAESARTSESSSSGWPTRCAARYGLLANSETRISIVFGEPPSSAR